MIAFSPIASSRVRATRDPVFRFGWLAFVIALAIPSFSQAAERVWRTEALTMGADLELQLVDSDAKVRGRVIAFDARGVSLKTAHGIAQFIPAEIASIAAVDRDREFALGSAAPRWSRPAAPSEFSQDGDDLTGAELQELEYQGRPWADIDPIVTPHYNLWCNSTLENAERYSDIMEELYAAYDKVFKKEYFPRTLPEGRARSNVWIHANHRQFMDWTGSPAGVGGFFRPHPSLQDVTAYHGSFGATASTDEVLAHEGTHQFQALIFKNMNVCPTWTIEGMAVYFGDGSEISRKEVEINKIPPDRLVGLQDAIRTGTYAPLNQLILIPHRQFSGFYYGHGWGIFYWFLYGNKSEPKAWKGDVGGQITTEWLLHVRDLDGQAPDHQGNARKFIGILEDATGKSADTWEEEYKEWILALEPEPIGKLRGSKWSSEKLGVEVARPAGWKLLRRDKLTRNEQVSFSASSSKTKRRRISTFVIPKFQPAALSVTGGQLMRMWSEIEYIDDQNLKELKIGDENALQSHFKARRQVRRESTVGGDETPEPEPVREYKIVLFGTKEKVYMNVLEVEVGGAARDEKSWQKYLNNFKILY